MFHVEILKHDKQQLFLVATKVQAKKGEYSTPDGDQPAYIVAVESLPGESDEFVVAENSDCEGVFVSTHHLEAEFTLESLST